MRIYTVHRRDGSGDDDLILVKEGFNWTAALFPVPWMLWYRLWWPLLGTVLLEGLLLAAMALAGLGRFGRPAVALGCFILFGYIANDLRRWVLRRRGYAETDVVSGPSLDGAEWRYFAEGRQR